MGGVDVEPKNGPGSTELKDAPDQNDNTSAPPPKRNGTSSLPIVRWIVPSRFPSTEECAFRTELSLQTWRWLVMHEIDADHSSDNVLTSTSSRWNASAKNSSEQDSTLAPKATLDNSAIHGGQGKLRSRG